MRVVALLFAFSLAMTAGCSCAIDHAPLSDAGTDAWQLDAATRDAATSDAATEHFVATGARVLASHASDIVYVIEPDVSALFVATRAGGVTRVALPEGSQPTALAEDGAGRVYVVLRRSMGGAGAVARVESGTVRAIVPVCPAPRGIAWRASDDTIWIACAGGELAHLPAGGAVAESTTLLRDGQPAIDLADVVVAGDRLLISRSHGPVGPEVLAVDTHGAVVAVWTLGRVTTDDPFSPDGMGTITMVPRVALRMVPATGGASLLFTRARAEPLPADTLASPSAIGGVLESAVAFVDAHAAAGEIASSLALPLAGASDLSVSEAGQRGTISTNDGDFLVFSGPSMVLGPPFLPPTDVASGDALLLLRSVGIDAHTFDASGRAVFLTRGPTVEWIDDAIPRSVSIPDAEPPLAAARRAFGASGQSGLACASCHPEGGDDGHAWGFAGQAPLRTLSLRGHVMGSAPFGREGDAADFTSALHTWLLRADGQIPDPSVPPMLERWLAGLDATPPSPGQDASAVARGAAAFHALGCADCHADPLGTNGATVDVGTGAPLQVPALVELAIRPPYMHDGCAATIDDVLTGPDACTGGAAHLGAHAWSGSERADLVAYLRTR